MANSWTPSSAAAAATKVTQNSLPPVPVTRGDYYCGDAELRSKTTIVRTKEEARVAVAALYAASSQGAIHACDTEVADIDLKKVGPVGNGYVTCVSIFSGLGVDYGDGPGKALWVDNLDDSRGVLQEFKAWFEDEREKKVWHNYGFDRHVLFNEGIDARGFAGDTMHMARLADSSRDKASGGGGGYGLAALTSDLVGDAKVPMKEIFGVGALRKDGTEGKVRTLPPIEELQRGSIHARHRPEFIRYSAFDAEGTWKLHQVLDQALSKMPWVEDSADKAGARMHSMREYYELVLVPFGVTLTDMERRGIKVNASEYLASLQVRAQADKDKCMADFVEWMVEVAGPDARYFNPQSGTQMQTLFFGGAQNEKKRGEFLPTERVVKVALSPEEVEELEGYELAVAAHKESRAKEAAKAAMEEKHQRKWGPVVDDAGSGISDSSIGSSSSSVNGDGPQSRPDGVSWGSLGLPPDSDATSLAASLTAVQLKEVCRACGVKVSGKKAELARRVEDAVLLAAAQPNAQGDGATGAATTVAVAGSQRQPLADKFELKKVEAEKTAEEERLKEAELSASDRYLDMSDESLRFVLRARNLDDGSHADRASLLREIRLDDHYAFALLHHHELRGQTNSKRGDHAQQRGRQHQASPPYLPPQPQQQQQQQQPLVLPAASTATEATLAAVASSAAERRGESSMHAVAAVAVGGNPSSPSSQSPPQSPETAPPSAMATKPAPAGGGASIGGPSEDSAFDALRERYRRATGRTGAKRYREVTVKSLGMKPTKFTMAGLPATSSDVVRGLAGAVRLDGQGLDLEKLGAANQFFGGGPKGLKACVALDALCRMGSIDTMLGTFIQPLQNLVDEESRVHCSLNFNTETGRLSSRMPNLQNQPALEKDQYKIRDAFCCEEGNQLIVADYGQLELRLLAHMTECKSMLQAFKDGGCFHSRTAVGMFEHVRKAVEDGEVLLEWDYSKGAPTSPLVKDVYGSERRKAKTLNFSIAYGKTPHGLSKDWGVSVKEAEGLLEAWYADRPEVKAWQQHVIKEARRTGFTRTLCGRYRKLNDITSPRPGLRGHAERAAINTPIQGGAADIVMLAMVKINNSPVLQGLGYRLLLQIHDEVILEGPEEHVEAALAEVVRCMEQPWDESGIGLTSLDVTLDVDAKYAKTWYKAK